MFKKIGKAMLAGMPPLGGTEAPFSHAALGPDDVEDARRGRPAIGLQGFAEAMGLAYRDQEMAGAFISTLPRWDNYIFNGMRGTLPGGRYGQLGHELLQVEIGSDGLRMTGTTYASRTTFTNRGFFGGGEAPKDEPFEGNYAFLPTTAVHVRAPETSRLPLMVIIEKSRTALMGNPKLDQHGLPGYRMVGSEHVTDQLTADFARICQPWLSTRNDPYLRVRVYHGVVNLTVNGYRSDPADLQFLMRATEAIADGLAGMMTGAPTPPFDAPGPGAGSLTLPGVSRPFPAYSTAFAEAARVYGMHDEDPLHLAHGRTLDPVRRVNPFDVRPADLEVAGGKVVTADVADSAIDHDELAVVTKVDPLEDRPDEPCGQGLDDRHPCRRQTMPHRAAKEGPRADRVDEESHLDPPLRRPRHRFQDMHR